MKIDGIKIIAEDGCVLRRASDLMIAGKEYYLGYIWELNGEKLDPPHLEVPEDFYDVPEDGIREDNLRYYPGLVDKYIREKYSVSDELAIQRQRDEKKTEFRNYYEYCESCKKRAKNKLGIEDDN